MSLATKSSHLGGLRTESAKTPGNPTLFSVQPLWKVDDFTRAGAAAANSAAPGVWRAALDAAAAELLAPVRGAGAPAAVPPQVVVLPAAATALAVRAIESASRRGAGAGEGFAPDASAALAATMAAASLAETPAAELAAACERYGGEIRCAMRMSAVPTLPRLLGLRTRVDVAITSDALPKVMRPVVTLEAQLSDARVVTFEVPADAFHELRHSVARTLAEMVALEAAPVLKIA